MPIKIESIKSDEVQGQFFSLKKDDQDFKLEVIDRVTWQKKKGESKASGDIYNLGKIVRVFNESQVTCKDPEALEALKTSLREKVRKHNRHPLQLLKFLVIPWILAKIFHWDSLLFYDNLKPLSVKKQEALKLANLERLAEYLVRPTKDMENLSKKDKILALENDLSQIKKIAKGEFSSGLDLTPLKSLESLYAQSSSQLPESIGELSSLKTLTLNTCRIWSLPFSCEKLQKLETLTLTHVPLSQIPEEIYSLSALSTLSIQFTSVALRPNEMRLNWDDDHTRALSFGKADAEKLLKMKNLIDLDFTGSLFPEDKAKGIAKNEGIEHLLTHGWVMAPGNKPYEFKLHKPIDTSSVDKTRSLFPNEKALDVEYEILSHLTSKELGVLSQVSRQAYVNVQGHKEKALTTKEKVFESIKSKAIGPDKWIKWGYNRLDKKDIDKAINALPLNIEEILARPDPLDPQKKIAESHLLVCDFGFSLERLWFFIEKKVPGLSSQLDGMAKYHSLAKSYFWSEEAASPRWVLLRRDLLPSSKDISFEEQEELVEKLAKDSNIPYTVPKARQVLAASLANFIETDAFLFSDQFTRTRDRCDPSSKSVANNLLMVGAQKWGGILMPIAIQTVLNSDDVGMTAVWELS